MYMQYLTIVMWHVVVEIRILNGGNIMLKAINIMWDVDDKMDLKHLPTGIIIPEGMTDEEEISDYISDETGFCHDGFEVVKEITKESVENELYDFFNDKMETGDVPEIERVGRYPDMYVTGDNGIVIDCKGGKQIRLIIQVD